MRTFSFRENLEIRYRSARRQGFDNTAKALIDIMDAVPEERVGSVERNQTEKVRWAQWMSLQVSPLLMPHRCKGKE